MTLIELLVAMVMLGTVSSIIVMAVSNATRVMIHADDENRGLQDAKVILDRLSRDIREARGVVCDGQRTGEDRPCSAHLQLWIDDDSDYLPDEQEIVTWELTPHGDGIHYDVWRAKGTGSSQTRQLQASALVVMALFTYCIGQQDASASPTSDDEVHCLGKEVAADPSQANSVTLVMEYDAVPSLGVGHKWASVSVRLRNKG